MAYLKKVKYMITDTDIKLQQQLLLLIQLEDDGIYIKKTKIKYMIQFKHWHIKLHIKRLLLLLLLLLLYFFTEENAYTTMCET